MLFTVRFSPSVWFVQIAKRQAVVNPENTFASVKRFIGRKMNEVAEESKQVPYKVILERKLTCFWPAAKSRSWLTTFRCLEFTLSVEEA